jgi:hypothetical protein
MIQKMKTQRDIQAPRHSPRLKPVEKIGRLEQIWDTGTSLNSSIGIHSHGNQRCDPQKTQR